MKAIGTVKTLVDDKTAIVVSKRSSACSSCHNCASKGACHAELVFGNQNEAVEVKAVNMIGAKPGDEVELENSSLGALFTVFIIFLLPLLLTVPFYFIFNSFNYISNVLPLLMIAVFVILFIICSFIMNGIAKNRISTSIVRILEESKDSFERE